MSSFVRDMHLHVHTPDGKTSVEAPHDVRTDKFLDDLREPLHLSSRDAEGHRIQWHIYDREERRLDPSKTLGDNGVRENHDLYFRQHNPESSQASPPSDPVRPIASDKGKVLLRCDNAHYYDPKKYRTCPYCDARGPRG